MNVIKKLNIFILVVVLLFQTIFSAYADEERPDHKIFNNDAELQERLSETFASYNPPGISQYLVNSMTTHEREIIENGRVRPDPYSRTVRIYSLPALFGGTDQFGNRYESALLHDLKRILEVAGPLMTDMSRHVDGRSGEVKQDELDQKRLNDYKNKAKRFTEDLVEPINDEFSREYIKERATEVMGYILSDYVCQKKAYMPSWWDKYFHKKEVEEKILGNKCFSNVIEVALLVMFAIGNEEWQCIDESGNLQYNDFLITAMDEVTRVPRKYWFGTTLKTVRDRPSVRFAKSNPPLYQMNYTREQLDNHFKLLKNQLEVFLGIVKSFNCSPSHDFGDVLFKLNQILKSEEYRRTVDDLVRRVRVDDGLISSLIEAITSTDPETRARIGRQWEDFVRTYIHNQDNLNRNFNERITQLEFQLALTDAVVRDLQNAAQRQGRTNNNLQNQIEALRRIVETLSAAQQMNLDDFNSHVRNEYDQGPPIFRRFLRILFPNAFANNAPENGLEVDNVV